MTNTAELTETWMSLHIKTHELSSNHLQSLINGDFSAIIIDNFYPSTACQTVSSRFKCLNCLKKEYRQKNVSTKYLGGALIEMAQPREKYFEKVQDFNEQVNRLFDNLNAPSPLKMILDLLSQVWSEGAQIAVEGEKPYFAGIVRNIQRSPLHNDLAHRDFVGWTIGAVKSQLSWNVYLQVPNNGNGVTQIWNRQWSPSDELYKNTSPCMMGYKYDLVHGCNSAQIEPVEGRLMIINSANYHEVHQNNETIDRISMSSFIGVIDKVSPLLLWS